MARIDELETWYWDYGLAGEYVQHRRPEDLDGPARHEERLMAARNQRNSELRRADRFRRALKYFQAVGKLLLRSPQPQRLAGQNGPGGDALKRLWNEYGVETIPEIVALAIWRFCDREDLGLFCFPGCDTLLAHGVLGRKARERADRAEK